MRKSIVALVAISTVLLSFPAKAQLSPVERMFVDDVSLELSPKEDSGSVVLKTLNRYKAIAWGMHLRNQQRAIKVGSAYCKARRAGMTESQINENQEKYMESFVSRNPEISGEQIFGLTMYTKQTFISAKRYLCPDVGDRP